MGIAIKEIHDCHMNLGPDAMPICFRTCCPLMNSKKYIATKNCPKTHEVKER
jgi:hypothetical protein